MLLDYVIESSCDYFDTTDKGLTSENSLSLLSRISQCKTVGRLIMNLPAYNDIQTLYVLLNK